MPGDQLLTPMTVVLAHPTAGSTCHRLAEVVRAHATDDGAEVNVRDLYAERFDPVLADDLDVSSAAAEDDPLVVRHRTDLASSRALVVVHPDWWGKPPAILSGWIDRVLVPVCRAVGPSGANRGAGSDAVRRVLVVNTSDEQVVDSDPLGLVWRRGIGRHLPTTDLERIALRGRPESGTEELARWEQVVRRATAWALGGAR